MTKQNLVCEGGPFTFLLLRDDVVKPRNTKSGPAEHEFGNCWTKIWEFTNLEFSHLIKRTELRSGMMLASGFDLSQDPNKVYQTTHVNWVNDNRTDSYLLHSGPVGVYENNGTVSEQPWEAGNDVIIFSPYMMLPFLADMRFKIEDMSHFCRHYTSPSDLWDTLSDTSQILLDHKAL